MEWSTKPARGDQPFGSWANDLAAAFVRLEPRKIAEHPFEGAISRNRTPLRSKFPWSRLQSTACCACDRILPVARTIFASSTCSSKAWGAPSSTVTSRSARLGILSLRIRPSLRNSELPGLQAVLFRRAAKPAAERLFRPPAVPPFGDGNRPRAIADSGRLCRALSRVDPRVRCRGADRRACGRSDCARTRPRC